MNIEDIIINAKSTASITSLLDAIQGTYKINDRKIATRILILIMSRQAKMLQRIAVVSHDAKRVQNQLNEELDILNATIDILNNHDDL
jgi:hypothetical protein